MMEGASVYALHRAHAWKLLAVVVAYSYGACARLLAARCCHVAHAAQQASSSIAAVAMQQACPSFCNTDAHGLLGCHCTSTGGGSL